MNFWSDRTLSKCRLQIWEVLGNFAILWQKKKKVISITGVAWYSCIKLSQWRSIKNFLIIFVYNGLVQSYVLGNYISFIKVVNSLVKLSKNYFVPCCWRYVWIICIVSKFSIEWNLPEDTHEGVGVAGYILVSGPRFYQLCPMGLRTSWFEAFKQSKFECTTWAGGVLSKLLFPKPITLFVLPFVCGFLQLSSKISQIFAP